MEITKEMSIVDVVNKHPHLAAVFGAHGMGCLGCAAARFENIEQGANAHEIDVAILVRDLNDALK